MRRLGGRIWCEYTQADEEVKGSLQDVYNVAEVVEGYECVVGLAAADEKIDELIY